MLCLESLCKTTIPRKYKYRQETVIVLPISTKQEQQQQRKTCIKNSKMKRSKILLSVNQFRGFA